MESSRELYWSWRWSAKMSCNCGTVQLTHAEPQTHFGERDNLWSSDRIAKLSFSGRNTVQPQLEVSDAPSLARAGSVGKRARACITIC
jgi:hypothetical protein